MTNLSIELREKLKETLPVSKRQKLEDKLSGEIKNVFLEVENYPEIKSGENFLSLQRGLEEVEKDIQQIVLTHDKNLNTLGITKV